MMLKCSVYSLPFGEHTYLSNAQSKAAKAEIFTVRTIQRLRCYFIRSQNGSQRRRYNATRAASKTLLQGTVYLWQVGNSIRLKSLKCRMVVIFSRSKSRFSPLSTNPPARQSDDAGLHELFLPLTSHFFCVCSKAFPSTLSPPPIALQLKTRIGNNDVAELHALPTNLGLVSC